MTGKSPDEIEREIERERTALEHSIEALQSQFRPEKLVDEASAYVRDHGPDLAAAIGKTVQRNPLAAAMTGVGVAWLLSSTASAEPTEPAPRIAGPDAPAPIPPRPARQPVATMPPPGGEFDRRVEAADAALRRDAPKNRSDTGALKGGSMSHSQINQLPENANLSDRAYASAADLRERIADGTHEMTEAARERVMRARAAAVQAQREIERHASEMKSRAEQASQERPLLVGALLFAAGAALAASLPRTSTENRALGSHRDRLFDEADRIFREEAVKLKAVAEAAVAEGQDIAKDAVKGEASQQSPATAIKQVSETAKSKARDENLGKIN